jgi:hypothetical protein
VQSVPKAALRSVHERAKVDGEVSGYHPAQELAAVDPGMMMAVPAPCWEQQSGDMPLSQLAAPLRDLAARVKLERLQKHPRKPTEKPAPQVRNDKLRLFSARLLDRNKRFK